MSKDLKELIEHAKKHHEIWEAKQKKLSDAGFEPDSDEVKTAWEEHHGSVDAELLEKVEQYLNGLRA